MRTELPAAVRPLRSDDLSAPWAPGREPGSVVLRVGADPARLEMAAGRSGVWLILRRPRRVLTARTVEEVSRLLASAEQEVASGRLAAGYLCYEAAPAFDPALVTVRTREEERAGGPLAWFGIYDEGVACTDLPRFVHGAHRLGAWRSRRNAEAQGRMIEAIRGWIAAGHVYQVNATHRLDASWRGDPWSCFLALLHAQRPAHAAFVHAGETVICSASPELLLRLRGGEVVTRPMKGTRPRGRTPDEDAMLQLELLRSAKERAENVMITDMARNDLGRIAEFGRVQVRALCAAERYPTVWQLVSTVQARTAAGLPACLRALFPAASITGAPKVRAMELIAELEQEPRGIYTGGVGVWGPGAWAEVNVAIRTLALDLDRGRAVYGTGGGIVWDSIPEREQAEARWKGRILTRRFPHFRLLETMRWGREEGCVLLERHLARLAASAEYFGFTWDEERVRRRLRESWLAWREGASPVHVVRLLHDARGRVSLATREMPPRSDGPWKVALAPRPIDREDLFLYHKTTHRAVYDRLRRAHPEADDVLLWNEEGELTESTIANLAVRLDGVWVTPPVTCGLLAGTMRAELIARGELQERVVRREDLAGAEEIRLCNSVRGWISVERIAPPAAPIC